MTRLAALLALATLAFSQSHDREVVVGDQAAKLPTLEEIRIAPRLGILGEAPLRLPEVIERVLANDPDLRISRIAREQAGYQITLR